MPLSSEHSRTLFEKIWIFTKPRFPCFHGNVIIVWWRLLWNMAWKAHFNIDYVIVFKLLIWSVSNIFWNVQLVRRRAPLGIATACLVNGYSTWRQFCAESFRVPVDNVSARVLTLLLIREIHPVFLKWYAFCYL